MSSCFRLTALSRLLVMVFMILQGLSLAHAASYGTDSHEHEGTICVIGTQVETDDIAPLPEFRSHQPASERGPILYREAFTSAPRLCPPARAPPPRAPPRNS
jgi:hypothetical protein